MSTERLATLLAACASAMRVSMSTTAPTDWSNMIRAIDAALASPPSPVELSDEQIEAVGDKWSYGKNEGSIRFEPVDFIAAVRECLAASTKGQP